MKKFVSAVLSILLVASMATAAMASAFVPSVTVKEPEIVGEVTITDAEGNVATVDVVADVSVPLDDTKMEVRVISVEALLSEETEVAIPAEEKQLFVDVYTAVAESTSVAEYVAALPAEKVTAPEGVDLSKYVVSSIQYVQASAALKEVAEGKELDAGVVDPGVKAGQTVLVLVIELVNGEPVYRVVEVVAEEDGIIPKVGTGVNIVLVEKTEEA